MRFSVTSQCNRLPPYGTFFLYQDCHVERSETSRIAQLNVPRGHGLESDLGAKKERELSL